MLLHEGHDHNEESCHCHQHTHADGTVHTHTHAHDHTHEHGEHEHAHTHDAGSTPEQTMALLGYMLNHNRDHAAEIHELAHRLAAEGKTEEAELIHKGVAFYNDGNDQLAEALKKLKGENC